MPNPLDLMQLMAQRQLAAQAQRLPSKANGMWASQQAQVQPQPPTNPRPMGQQPGMTSMPAIGSNVPQTGPGSMPPPPQVPGGQPGQGMPASGQPGQPPGGPATPPPMGGPPPGGAPSQPPQMPTIPGPAGPAVPPNGAPKLPPEAQRFANAQQLMGAYQNWSPNPLLLRAMMNRH